MTEIEGQLSAARQLLLVRAQLAEEAFERLELADREYREIRKRYWRQWLLFTLKRIFTKEKPPCVTLERSTPKE